jgi:4-hydroxybenzoate polyprenyltransferase
MSSKPLVVDLDGTILRTDLLQESALSLMAASPMEVFKIPYYCFSGKASLKKVLATKVDIDAKLLPYNLEFLDWLKDQKSSGIQLILCTGSDELLAKKVAAHLDLFDDVMASNGVNNLTGQHKASALVERFGINGFDYAGNSEQDLPVWAVAQNAIVVNGSKSLYKKASKICKVSHHFLKNRTGLKLWARALRTHQWVKNLLLFAPMIAAHLTADFDAWISVFIGFLAFSGCASSIYLINDLLDLEHDRAHPRKRNRPLASGDLPFLHGILLVPLLLGLSLGLGSFLNDTFVMWLVIYLGLTTAYSFVLKPIIFVDVLALAMLYTLRIIAGAATLALSLSPWLLAFSIFFFVSLAFVKRYAELEIQILKATKKIRGRGYLTSDAPLVQSIGSASGFCSILVFVLYLNSPEVISLYQAPEIMWLSTPILIYWQSWMWLSAHRGEMHDDPIMFAIKDKPSLISGVMFLGVLLMGTVGL